MNTENEIRLMLADYPDSLPSDEELMIAVFMGLRPLIVNEHHKIVGWYRDDPKNWFSFPEYKTWNSLMPVVEKIEKTPTLFHTRIMAYADENNYLCDIVNGEDNEEITCVFSTESKLNAVYKAVVDFIRWHNSQNS